MRNNIFERLHQHGYDIGYEICKIHDMFTEEIYMLNDAYGRGTPKTIEEMVEMFSFHTWRQRKNLVSLSELKSIIKIHSLLRAIADEDMHADEYSDEIIIYLEYMLNALMLAEKIELKYRLQHKFSIYRNAEIDEVKYQMLAQNITILLDNMNLEKHFIKREEKTFLVEKDATVTAVAEIVSNDLFYPVIEYNHHLLRGNITRKREILKKFADDLEPKRKELKTQKKDAEDLLFYMFNKLNIRHNNNNIEKVAQMSNKELERWYDDVYQLVLYCYLILDSNPRIARLNDLKDEIEKG